MRNPLLIMLAVCAFSFSLSAQSINKLSPKEQKAGYKLLFDGATTTGWHVYNTPSATGWKVTDGSLTVDTTSQVSGDLVTNGEYKNFELKLDWNIPVGGNSGVIFSIHEDTSYHYTFLTGMEMQVLDDINAEDNKQANHLAGSLYDMIAPSHPAKPAGEWNSIIIRKLNGHLTFYMNGLKTVDVQMGSPEWNMLLQKSKFRKWKDFATYPTGHISLQYHGAAASFRNIRIKQL